MAVVIPFRREMQVDYGRLEVVAPGLRRIHARNPSAFTFHGTGTYLVGTGAVAVIDPGPADPGHVGALLEGLAASGERVGSILVTHTHSDHSPAAALLKAATGAPVYGFAAAHRPATSFAEPGETTALDEDEDAGFVPDHYLRDGDRVSGPDFTLTALHTPGHLDNHLCFAWAETEALFTGDHIMGWATSVVVPPDGDMAAYMASLARVAARRDRILYPTHGPAIDEPQPFIAAYIAHRHEREAQILAALWAGLAEIRAIVSELYRSVDPRLHPAAAMSVLAHLLDLHARGLVVTADRPGLRARWRAL